MVVQPRNQSSVMRADTLSLGGRRHRRAEFARREDLIGVRERGMHTRAPQEPGRSRRLHTKGRAGQPGCGTFSTIRGGTTPNDSAPTGSTRARRRRGSPAGAPGFASRGRGRRVRRRSSTPRPGCSTKAGCAPAAASPWARSAPFTSPAVHPGGDRRRGRPAAPAARRVTHTMKGVSRSGSPLPAARAEAAGAGLGSQTVPEAVYPPLEPPGVASFLTVASPRRHPQQTRRRCVG